MNADFFPHLLRFHPRLLLAIGVGILAGVFAQGHFNGVTRTLIGWNAGAWAYLAMIWFMMVTAPKRSIERFAEQEDQSAVLVLSVVSLSAIASVAAIVHELASAKSGAPHQTSEHVLFAAATLIAGWFLVPTIYTLHYARLYFTDAQKPFALVWPDRDCDPDYWDFLYFSFTIAVASQTADIALASRRMRRAVLAQAILSFFFNLAVLGLSINIGASLLS
ncbi:DUF1345 domain-containing protein [Pandoraea nosoerga]|uniref:Membrane protein n=1 Tax=Pandoraea nosoerga TaxID=2508296 RepID=A0A5E4UYB8_9BURK|nr:MULTISPECIES: DUF1345 domain-containing protein [Pandoraea]MBN4667484.1 DUF1345 domain-containing protein [Pandoraea nosoerga]MBN4676475.1 DUF1345 domain-containing protein [Pandoraea nosoerga]MBN4682280.1 DUF1345 domain-containing protein [Pandoraea nosoerga]MBN4745745.1 DUF1345 domain-containing protein [Pandoraea nosoerga]VVE04916.1 membrane protein [Pandoraea nosoerga]